MACPYTVAQKRQLWEQLALRAIRALPLPDDIEEFWTTITLPDGWESRTKVTRPKTNAPGERRPLIVYLYGASYVAGTPNMVTRPARDFASEMGAVVVAPSYKLAPEAPWPAPLHSVWEVLVHLSRHAERDFGASLDDGFVVGGLSAGANAAAVAWGIETLSNSGDSAVEKLEKLEKPITGLFLNCPFLLAEEIVPHEYRDVWTSRTENAHSKPLDTAAVEKGLRYLNTDASSPWYSPIGVLASLTKAPRRGPSFFIQVGRLDPVRDDGVVLKKMLSSRGFPTLLHVLPEDGHVAWVSMPWPTNSTNPTVGESTIAGMKWLLREA
ncbi:hypothetical protein G6O67_006153 [Ophiocordyceps sinensis]|uniref:Alpha/beta hydrolase fold-3 domain-containing protein n=2 Tax=Ophiocordyceps sinensis TaxID=72228 RepID=A0A8H4LUU2_9HYPO|nr:Alpha/beta hydrolase fold-3 [Ophiocordyceps sinensis CO18]KAF4506028.1 hypothetical protein G6O67_006153 [Ophiocordyceps sinensis]